MTGKSALQMGLGFVYMFVYAQNVKYLNAKRSLRSKCKTGENVTPPNQNLKHFQSVSV